jgi:hypothetical protein
MPKGGSTGALGDAKIEPPAPASLVRNGSTPMRPIDWPLLPHILLLGTILGLIAVELAAGIP